MGVTGQICLFIFGMEICPCNTMSATLNGKKIKTKSRSLSHFSKKALVKNTKELHGSPLIWLRYKEMLIGMAIFGYSHLSSFFTIKWFDNEPGYL